MGIDRMGEKGNVYVEDTIEDKSARFTHSRDIEESSQLDVHTSHDLLVSRFVFCFLFEMESCYVATLECSVVILAHGNLCLPETGLHHVGQDGLKLLTSGDPLALASQSAEIIESCSVARLECSGVISAHCNLCLLGS
ncbi:hypothetical protein AAY473_036770, partial [Plecturocebus cupreus]